MAIGPHAESEADVLEKHDLSAPAGQRLSVTVVMPQGRITAGVVDEIIAPGVQGEFGVLPGHVAFISALKPGVLTVRTGDRREVFAVGPGYLEVGAGGKTQVLVQQAIAGGEVDVVEARAEKAAAEEQLKAATGAAGEQSTLEGRLAWAQAQIDAAAKAGG